MLSWVIMSETNCYIRNNMMKELVVKEWLITYQTVRLLARRISSASSPVKSRTAVLATFSKLVPKLSLQKTTKYFPNPRSQKYSENDNYYRIICRSV